MQSKLAQQRSHPDCCCHSKQLPNYAVSVHPHTCAPTHMHIHTYVHPICSTLQYCPYCAINAIMHTTETINAGNVWIATSSIASCSQCNASVRKSTKHVQSNTSRNKSLSHMTASWESERESYAQVKVLVYGLNNFCFHFRWAVFTQDLNEVVVFPQFLMHPGFLDCVVLACQRRDQHLTHDLHLCSQLAVMCILHGIPYRESLRLHSALRG